MGNSRSRVMVVQAIRNLYPEEVKEWRARGADIVVSPWTYNYLYRFGVTQIIQAKGLRFGIDQYQAPKAFVPVTEGGKIMVVKLLEACVELKELLG